MSKLIKLTQGKHAIVDDDDYEWLMGWKWCARWSGYTWYARSSKQVESKQVFIQMHNLILDTPSGQQGDHRNHNGLDNRRSNIRIATRSQNGGNRLPVIGKSSKFKGVSFDRARNIWEANIGINHRKIRLGRYHNETEAAKAYDIAALKHFGEFAMTNIQLFGVT